VIAKLMWKEWVEHRWKLALGLVILAGLEGVGLHARIVADELVLVLALAIGGFLWPLLVGMDLLAGDAETGTLGTLLSLPVGRWRVLGVKLAMGAAAILAPVLGAGVAALLLAGGREWGSWQIVRAHLGMAALALSVLVWMLAFGARQPSEARAALVGLGVLGAWALAGVLGSWAMEHLGLPECLMVLHPATFMAALDPPKGRFLLTVLAFQAPIAAALVWWMARRFGQGRERV
jgi:hypothetical protein